MWLLDTHRAELHKFLGPDSIPDTGYAILSHCWAPEGEQVFQDIEALKAQYGPGDNPRDHVSAKIKNFCILAEQLGYKWGWVDTCCIDKTSSSELTEAIKSMFRYYAQAAVCIVFLHDVPDHCDLDTDESRFHESRWHRRCWTLQELIAPKKVWFYSEGWQKLCTRAERAALLEKITGISEDVLRGKKDVTAMSIAARLSWAASRQATREEDEAYSLLGILKVDMYTSYGEGRHAFYRLQEELIKRSTDTSLFAWGLPLNLADLRNSTALWVPDTIGRGHEHPNESFLFAPTPAYFSSKGLTGVHFAPNLSIGSTGCAFDISGILTFSTSPYGILAHFPVAELKTQRLLVAFIACSMNGKQLGLVLDPCSNADATSPNGLVYDISSTNRLVMLEDDDPHGLLVFEWRDLYIRTSPPAGHNIQVPEEFGEQKQGSIPTIMAPISSPLTNVLPLNTVPATLATSPMQATMAMDVSSPPTALLPFVARQTSPPPGPQIPPQALPEAPPMLTRGPPTTATPLPPSMDSITTLPSRGAAIDPTSAPLANGDAYTYPMSNFQTLSTSLSTNVAHPSSFSPPLRTETQRPVADAPPPSTATALLSETKEQPGASGDAPPPAQVNSQVGREERLGKAQRREGVCFAWVRRVMGRVAMAFGFPVAESS